MNDIGLDQSMLALHVWTFGVSVLQMHLLYDSKIGFSLIFFFQVNKNSLYVIFVVAKTKFYIENTGRFLFDLVEYCIEKLET